MCNIFINLVLLRGHGARNRQGNGQDGNIYSAVLQGSADLRSRWFGRGGHRQMLQGTSIIHFLRVIP